ncbi:MAG: hypothetical protein ACXAB4_09030 [Candidatus Hodarchaeales archaeon]|jgi:hypothetical protein
MAHPNTQIEVTLENQSNPIPLIDSPSFKNLFHVFNAFFKPLVGVDDFFETLTLKTVHVNQDLLDTKYWGSYRRVEVFQGIVLAAYQRKKGIFRKEVEINESMPIEEIPNEELYRSMMGHKTLGWLLNLAAKTEKAATITSNSIRIPQKQNKIIIRQNQQLFQLNQRLSKENQQFKKKLEKIEEKISSVNLIEI